jgi:imidazolonepropionase-like amidohydrolase
MIFICVYQINMKKILFALFLFFTQAGVAQNLVIKGAVVYSSPQAKPIINAVVVVKNGKIARVGEYGTVTIPKGIPVIDAKGMFLTAGFWNNHVHFTEPKWNGADTAAAARLTSQLNDMTNSRGFTYVFDLAELDFENLKALRNRIDKGEVPGPSIRAVGVPLTPENGSPFYIRPAKLPEVGDTATAVGDVIAQIKAGAKGIKLFTGSPNGKEIVVMNVDVIKAVVKTAHRYGVPVFAHPSTEAGVNAAIAGGVDILAHVAPDAHRDWDQPTIKSLVQKHIAVVPTLKMFQWSLLTSKQDTTNNPLITTALQQLGSFAKAGGVVLFGTDVGYMNDYSTEAEFDLMSRAGLDFKLILASLTTAPAKKYGLQNITGMIAPGMNADIVLLSADPANDTRNFSRVAYTIAKGRVIYNRSIH